MFTILIIEDNLDIQIEIESSIKTIRKQTKILKTRNGEEALKVAGLMEIDVFMIDLGLPDWDG